MEHREAAESIERVKPGKRLFLPEPRPGMFARARTWWRKRSPMPMIHYLNAVTQVQTKVAKQHHESMLAMVKQLEQLQSRLDVHAQEVRILERKLELNREYLSPTEYTLTKMTR